MIGLDLAALELLVTWTFAFQLRGIYAADAGSIWRRLVDLAYGAVLTPPGKPIHCASGDRRGAHLRVVARTATEPRFVAVM